VRAAWLIALLACSTGAKQTGPDPAPNGSMPPRNEVKPRVYLVTPKGETVVDVEIVSTEAKIRQGLMYRQHLALDAGMLFLLDTEKDWSFWMRNTLIPLDMIFIKKDMTIAGIVQNAEPQTETLRKVNMPSLYVLEVNGGWTAAHGVVAGVKVRFENVR
jgi:uncharacterized membrane protein (UPF0127 family)